MKNKYRVHPNNRYPNKTIDIIMLSANRKECTEKTIDYIYDRVEYPDKIKLIVVDDESVDGTVEMLKQKKKDGKVNILLNSGNNTISAAYNAGFAYVKSEYFLMMQNDIRAPKLNPDFIVQFQNLMEKYPEQAGIGAKIERVPNMDWTLGNKDLVPARKALSAYCRIQLRDDYRRMGMLNSQKTWDDINFLYKVREVLKMDCSWAKNIWCSHKMGYAPNRNYKIVPRKWGFGHLARMNQAIEKKPYPKVDEFTNIPLPGEKIYR